MKFHKLLVSAATVCLLTVISGCGGNSGDDTTTDFCLDGFIVNLTVGDVIVNGRECFILDTVVLGDVQVSDSASFTISKSRVLGSISVSGSEQANVIDNRIFNNSIDIRTSDVVTIVNNTVEDNDGVSNLFLTSNTSVGIYHNTVDGSITCINNATVKSSGNVASGGIDGC